jgi:hypothetical protein
LRFTQNFHDNFNATINNPIIKKKEEVKEITGSEHFEHDNKGLIESLQKGE